MTAHPTPAWPTSPRDLPADLTPQRLVDALAVHQAVLLDVHLGLTDPPPATELTARAIAVLAVRHALVERLLAGRWVNASDALDLGATVGQVADAMGLDADEVVAGLRSWADGQLRYGFISDAQHDAVVALVEDGE